jgi:hypothetical protein
MFSANGATFTVSLGRRPRRHGKKASALKARFTAETKFVWNQKSIEATEARLQRLVIGPAIWILGRCPRLEGETRLWRKEIEWKALFQRDAETENRKQSVGG